MASDMRHGAVFDIIAMHSGNPSRQIQPVSHDDPRLMCRIRDPEGAEPRLIQVAKA